ncbi:MAG: hypothetical protein AB4368_13765 [Xenococcaceae cyanobacterium]
MSWKATQHQLIHFTSSPHQKMNTTFLNAIHFVCQDFNTYSTFCNNYCLSPYSRTNENVFNILPERSRASKLLYSFLFDFLGIPNVESELLVAQYLTQIYPN